MGDIDLLMIGKTGNGKSALGNTILRRKAFLSINKTTSVTTEVQSEWSEYNDRVIKVVDGPGVGDTRMDTEKATKLVMDAMSKAISANPEGYHAFLLVVKYGGRFTAEDNDTIDFLKKIFGETFVRHFCILIVNCGDNFERDSEDTGLSFRNWCREQEGVFHDLFVECNGRALLFDNKSKDEGKISRQIDELIQMVDNLTFIVGRYRDVNFDKAKTERERIMIEAKKPIIRDETMKETSLIIQNLQRIQTSNETENSIAKLEELFTRTETLYNSIKTQDNGTGALHDLVETVSSLMTTIKDEIRFINRLAREKENMKQQEAERLEEEKRRLREDLERQIKQEQLDEKKRKALEKEDKKRQRELEERHRLETKEREREMARKYEIEREEIQKRTQEIERKYVEAKSTNEGGFLSAVASTITWPFRKLFG